MDTQPRDLLIAGDEASDSRRRRAAEAALDMVTQSRFVGLGTGRTTEFLIHAIARLPRRSFAGVKFVSTSRRTTAAAVRAGLPIFDLDEVPGLDVTFDGADEIGPGLSAVKGGGGALLGEKLVWSASTECILIADRAKLVAQHGAFPLPVEVVAMGHAKTALRIHADLEGLGCRASLNLRTSNGAPVLTDHGHVLYDASFERIEDPEAVAAALDRITGVVDHGFFLSMASQAWLGEDEGVLCLENSKAAIVTA